MLHCLETELTMSNPVTYATKSCLGGQVVIRLPNSLVLPGIEQLTLVHSDVTL